MLKTQKINFKNKEGYYLSEDIKYLKKIKKISFNVVKKSEQKISFTIYQNFYGENKYIFKSDLIDLKVGKNIIDLDLDVLNSYNNCADRCVKFGNVSTNKNFIINEVNLFIKDEIDLSNSIILEKYKNCYLISKK